MVSYRPVTDVWLLARPRVKYYGAYPSGFLERARALLGVGSDECVLHVCSGKIRDYPFRGLGKRDKFVDLDPEMNPDYLMDVSKSLPDNPDERYEGEGWPAILMDPPYTEEDAEHYAPGKGSFPNPNKLIKLGLEKVRPGGMVGMLHYMFPRPQKVVKAQRYFGHTYDAEVRLVACIGVSQGWGNRMRCYSVFKKVAPEKELIDSKSFQKIREGVGLVQ